MSHLLRHGAVEAGLGDAMDASGYVLVRDVLALPRFAGITEADVRQLVASCPKRRFELRGPISAGASGTTPRPSTAAPASSSSLSIRATQGHTMSSANTKLEDDLMLTRLDERAAAFVAEAAHGTTTRAWANIKTEGVKRMRRRHVHMARASHEGWSAFMTPNATETAPLGCSIECNGLGDEGSSEAPRTDCVPSGAARGAVAETDGEAFGVRRAGDGGGVSVISGFRADARVAVWVDVARGVREGVPFFLSANGVVLSPGEGDTGAIPPRLFLRATDLKTGEALAL